MLERKNKFRAIFIGAILLLGAGMPPSCADESITFGPRETKIEGSIKYLALGNYTAHFKDFKGQVIWDENSRQVRSVYLNITAASIKSEHPRYDRLALSRRLLYARRYPKIIFKSDKIIRDGSGYKVEGVLEMRGIKRRMLFPFKAGIAIDEETKRKILEIRGRWVINRKDFNIIWNKYLDQGGVLVSDDFIVDWGIRAYIK